MNVIVIKEIKLIKMEKKICKRRKFHKNKTKVFKVVTKINVACRIRTNNAELKNINVQYSSVSHSLKKGQGAGQKKGTFDAWNSPKRALLLETAFQM